MGILNKKSSEKRKKKKIVYASLRSNPISPRKMRVMADLIRGVGIENALSILEFNKKKASYFLRKLLFSALANWKMKNKDISEEYLYVKEIKVDNSYFLKRLRPVPQGQGHQIRKRFNHVRVKIENRKYGK
ncbi:MAG TPA: 50S ribosomal protein L22 [Blattabacteriaceae bacterium]